MKSFIVVLVRLDFVIRLRVQVCSLEHIGPKDITNSYILFTAFSQLFVVCWFWLVCYEEYGIGIV